MEDLLTMPARHRSEGDHHPSTSTAPGTTSQAVRKWDSAADGLHTYIVLLEGSGGVDDCVILQVKEATDSVLSPCFGPSIYGHHD